MKKSVIVIISALLMLSGCTKTNEESVEKKAETTEETIVHEHGDDCDHGHKETTEAAAKAQHMHQTECVVTGEAVNSGLYVEKDHKRIYISNESAREELETNFDKYAADLEKEGYHLGTH